MTSVYASSIISKGLGYLGSCGNLGVHHKDPNTTGRVLGLGKHPTDLFAVSDDLACSTSWARPSLDKYVSIAAGT